MTDKPAPFATRGGVRIATCEHDAEHRWVELRQVFSLDAKTSVRFAAWLLEAAAWLEEGP